MHLEKSTTPRAREGGNVHLRTEEMRQTQDKCDKGKMAGGSPLL